MVALLAAAGLFVLFLSANGIAGVYTDWLWFDALGQPNVWSTILTTQLLLVAIFAAAFFAVLWGNLVLADRLKPSLRAPSAEEDLVERYHAAVGVHGGKVRFAIAFLFALISGANTASQWQSWVLFRNGGDFGRTDPLFGRDAGFYVFKLPFLSFVVDWIFATMVLTIVVVLIAHYLNGGIRAAAASDRVAAGVKLHLSILLAVLAVLRAGSYWLDRFHLLTSERGVYDGALATDVNIQLPALNLLILISLFCAALFVANIRRAGWGLPAVALGIWFISNFVIGGIFPAVYQRLRVQPVQSQREAEFVAHNIAATRFAYGLDDAGLTTIPFDYQEGLVEGDLASYESLIANIPVVDPSLATEELERDEAERGTYQFSDKLDVDRYMVDGQARPVVLSVRSLKELGNTWEKQHIIFTHGYGAVMASAYDEGAGQGNEARRLNYLIDGLEEARIDPNLETVLPQPRTYYGEGFNEYSIVSADRDETDFLTSDNQSISFRYDGDGGVSIGSLPRRLAFALRFGEPDPLISQSLTSDSRVLYHRNVRERVQKLAPFLRFDSDPYPVLLDDGVHWVLGGFTTSSEFPYSESSTTTLAGNDDFNYVRDSVKAVVNAYTGDVTLYIIDENDPVIAAWDSAFPSLFTENSQMPTDLRDHMKYPADIFTVQSNMWSLYVVDDATEFIDKALAWSVATKPPAGATGESADPGSDPMPPQYLMAQLPGSDSPEFVAQRLFVPRASGGPEDERPLLKGVLMARSDPANYGQLVLLEPQSGSIPAPSRVHNEIAKSNVVTNFVGDKLRSEQDVVFGEMSTVVIDDTVLFVRSIYVQAKSGNTIPELQRVVAATGVADEDDQTATRIAMGRTLADAVNGVLGADALSTEGAVYDPTGKSVIDIIQDIEDLSLAASSIEATNPEEAARLRAQEQSALQALKALLGGESNEDLTSTGEATVEEAATETETTEAGPSDPEAETIAESEAEG